MSPHSPTVRKLQIDGPQPLPNSLPPVPPFEAELLPSVLSVSALEVSKTKQAPLDFVAVGYMTALSSLLARHIAIRPMAHTDWTVVPNLWGMIVGRPSAKKTPAISASLRPLDRLEDAAAERHCLDQEDYEVRKQLQAHQEKANASKIQALLKKGTAQDKSDAAALIQEQQESGPAEPACIRYLANDTTVEKLADLQQTNPSILVFRDELTGFLASLERHGQETARSFYLEAWTGDKPFKVDRIGRGSTRIPRACVSVLGGIQPGPIASLMRELSRTSRSNDGLLQRFQLTVWPDLPKTFELVDTAPNADNNRDVVALFERCATLNASAIGATVPEEGVPYLRFSDSAQAVFSRWVEAHENRLRREEMPECMEAHLGKYASLVPALALILHVADQGHPSAVPDRARGRLTALDEISESLLTIDAVRGVVSYAITSEDIDADTTAMLRAIDMLARKAAGHLGVAEKALEGNQEVQHDA